jgi:allantoinase
MLARLMAWCPTPVHVVHVSSASTLEIVRAARRAGLPMTAETCPHHLTFAAEEVPDGATEYKCAPPIRSAAEREALWAALVDGGIDMIASDHSPCPPEMKGADGDFFAAWGGVASLELSLAAVWTGARARGIGVERVAQWMCAAPARLAALRGLRGTIAAGRDADLVVWDPDARFTGDAEGLRQRHKVTPYAGRTLYGAVQATYVGGRLVYDGA